MRSNTELFEIMKALYVSELGGNIDRLATLCAAAMKKMPDDPITAGLLQTTIDTIVAAKDRVEIKKQRELLTREEREIYEAIDQMTDEELRQFADENPDQGEPAAALLFHRDEVRRLSEEARIQADRLERMINSDE